VSVTRLRAVTALVLACAVGACASTPESKHDPRVVARAELPARQREVWEQYERDGAAWEIAREDVRRDPALARFMVDNLVIELVHANDHSGHAPSGGREGPYERAQAELVYFQDSALPVLTQMLSVKDGIVAFLAADTLKKIGAPAAEPVARDLDDPSPEVRRRAAELLGELPHVDAIEPALLEKLGERTLHDTAWIVRAQAALALGTRGARHAEKGYAVSVLARATGDPDATVAESAAQGLERVGDPRAIPILIRALEQAVRQGQPKAVTTIQSALKKLSGQSRDRDAEEWWRWWEHHPVAAAPEAR
jgi:hypothetical protein